MLIVDFLLIVWLCWGILRVAIDSLVCLSWRYVDFFYFLQLLDDHVVYVFKSIYVVNYICWLVYVELSLHFMDRGNLVMMYNPFWYISVFNLQVFYWVLLSIFLIKDIGF